MFCFSDAGSPSHHGTRPPSDCNSVFTSVASLHSSAAIHEDHVSISGNCCRRCSCPASCDRRKVAVGGVMVAFGAVCWVGATQCAKRLYNWPSFYPPFFVVYFSTSWVTMFYPISLSVQFIRSKGQLDVRETLR